MSFSKTKELLCIEICDDGSDLTKAFPRITENGRRFSQLTQLNPGGQALEDAEEEDCPKIELSELEKGPKTGLDLAGK